MDRYKLIDHSWLNSLILPSLLLYERLHHMTWGQNQLHCLLNGHEMKNKNVPDIYTYESLLNHKNMLQLKTNSQV